MILGQLYPGKYSPNVPIASASRAPLFSQNEDISMTSIVSPTNKLLSSPPFLLMAWLSFLSLLCSGRRLTCTRKRRKGDLSLGLGDDRLWTSSTQQLPTQFTLSYTARNRIKSYIKTTSVITGGIETNYHFFYHLLQSLSLNQYRTFHSTKER